MGERGDDGDDARWRLQRRRTFDCFSSSWTDATSDVVIIAMAQGELPLDVIRFN